MSAIKLHVIKPSVNNMTARVFVRAAKLDFTEDDVYGKTRTPDFLAKNPAHLTPMMEAPGLPKGVMWESCAIMQYLCNKHHLDKFYPTEPEKRAMVDSAMFYIVGTLYPYIVRSTYGALGFPQYPGEVGARDAEREKEKAQKAAAGRSARRSTRSTSSFLTARPSSAATRRRSPTSVSRQPRIPARSSTTIFPNGRRPTWARSRRPSATPTRSRRRRSRLRVLGDVRRLRLPGRGLEVDGLRGNPPALDLALAARAALRASAGRELGAAADLGEGGESELVRLGLAGPLIAQRAQDPVGLHREPPLLAQSHPTGSRSRARSRASLRPRAQAQPRA